MPVYLLNVLCCPATGFWCPERKLTIRVEHIPGRDNKGADQESRKGTESCDWTIHRKMFKRINSRWGPLDVDLFAARHNTQLQRFFSYHLDPLAESVDAMEENWVDLNLHAVSPFMLIDRILQKIWREEVNQVVLTAPVWSN